MKSGSQPVQARSPGCHSALALVGRQHCIHIHPHLPVQYSGLRALVFPLEAQQLQHGERGVGSHGAGCWLTHHALADEAATRLFAARLCPKQNLAFQVAAAALAKTTFFFSTVQTITGPYQLLSKIKHSPGAVHYAGSRAVCNHGRSGFGRKSFNKIKPNSESIHFSHSIQ